MTSQTTEQAFESTVESMLLGAGWRAGDLGEWDVERALFPARAVAFIRETQPDEWARMAGLHGDDVESLVVAQLARELDTKGTIEVLRHGFRFSGRTFRLAYFAPAHGLNPDALARFERNDLTVTRQAPCHPGKGDTLDLVFALNGVPVATCELKNPMTGQDWRNAVRQYQQDRDPNAPLFRFKRRALVHFAADPDEVHMTTRLAGAGTRFLPFNRGSSPGAVHCGAGNPANPDGYRTDYFWREVLERERFLDILGSYVFLETREEKVEGREGCAHREARDDDLPALPPARRRARARRGCPRRRAGAQLPHPALGGQRQDEQHLVALAPPREPAHRRRREGLRLRRCHHRPAHPRPPVAGRHLPDRARPGRGAGHRRELAAARGGARRRHEDRHHDAAEVPVRHEGPPARRRGRLGRCALGGRTCASRCLARGDRRAPLRGHRRRGALEPDGRQRARDEGSARIARPGGSRRLRGLGGRPQRRHRVTRPAAQPLVLRVHGDPERQDHRAVRPAGTERQAGAVPRLQHAAGDRGGLHPRRAPALHRLRHLLPHREEGRGRPRVPEAPRRRRARDVPQSAPG